MLVRPRRAQAAATLAVRRPSCSRRVPRASAAGRPAAARASPRGRAGAGPSSGSPASPTCGEQPGRIDGEIGAIARRPDPASRARPAQSIATAAGRARHRDAAVATRRRGDRPLVVQADGATAAVAAAPAARQRRARPGTAAPRLAWSADGRAGPGRAPHHLRHVAPDGIRAAAGLRQGLAGAREVDVDDHDLNGLPVLMADVAPADRGPDRDPARPHRRRPRARRTSSCRGSRATG